MSLRASLAGVIWAGLSACCLSPVTQFIADGGSPNDTNVDGGEVHDAGSRPTTQCTIGSYIYAAGVLDPENSCQSCQPTIDPSHWTNLPAGTRCPGSGLCDSRGACIAPACDIGGVVYPRGAAKPQDPSFCCSPALNGSDWSLRLQDGGVYQADQQLITAIVAADFDGDGRKDLAVMSGQYSERPPYRPTVNVWLARDGGFEGPAVYLEADCQLCSELAIGDVNGDGFPDLLIPNTFVPPQKVLALLNSGDGTGRFGQGIEQQFPPLGNVGDLILVDLDRDGILDMAYTGFAEAYFLKGIGDGGFAEPVAYPLGEGVTWTSSIVAGDFRNRGILDLVTANASDWPLPGSITMLTGDGHGLFSPRLFATGLSSYPGPLAVGDFNGDGFLDLAFSDTILGVGFYPGAGDGTFGVAVTPDLRCPDWNGFNAPLSVADLDRNGRSDFIVQELFDTSFTIFWSNSDGTISKSSVVPVADAVTFLATDLNEDGTPDLVMGSASGAVTVLVNECL